MKPASRMSEMMGRYRTPALASLCAFCAAWMVMMANRYFTQSAADLEGGRLIARHRASPFCAR